MLLRQAGLHASRKVPKILWLKIRRQKHFKLEGSISVINTAFQLGLEDS